MGGGSTPSVTPPPVPEPEAIPETQDVSQVGEKARKKKPARRKTFLTGNLEPETLGKKTLLGGP